MVLCFHAHCSPCLDQKQLVGTHWVLTRNIRYKRRIYMKRPWERGAKVARVEVPENYSNFCKHIGFRIAFHMSHNFLNS